MLNKKLAKKILDMVKIDQKIRKAKKIDLKKMKQIDEKSTSEMKEVIKEYGWPGKSLVGDKGADGAWLLVQHADHDLQFQKKCLRLLMKAVKIEEAKKSHLAYLTDRVLMHEKRKQLYGTQFKIDKKSNTVLPFPITDRENLEERRKSMGLQSFRKYEKLVVQLFKNAQSQIQIRFR